MRSHRSEGCTAPLAASLLLVILLGGLPAIAAELLVGAAISVQAPLAEAGRRYETLHPEARIHFTFGASSALAAQVRAGAPIDVLVSANERILESLAEDGAVDATSRFTLARNRLVVVVPVNEPDAEIAEPGDLLAPEVERIAIPIAAVPLGGYARDWLRSRGLLDAISKRIVPTPHARATLVAVENRHVDAAIVYATDARATRAARIAFEIPDVEQPVIRYAAVAVAGSRQPELAVDFLAFLRSEAVEVLLQGAGFALP
jgi:molybdate transport system substrate-binding protein